TFIGGGDGLARNFDVVEWMHGAADDLAALMALAGDDEDVARPKRGDGLEDRIAARADFGRTRTRRHDLAPDCGGVLAARVVVSDDGTVGQLLGDGAHHRPLAGIA